MLYSTVLVHKNLVHNQWRKIRVEKFKYGGPTRRPYVGRTGEMRFALYLCGHWVTWWVRLVFLNYFVVLLLLNLFWYSIKCWWHAWCSLADANVRPIFLFDRCTAIPMSANKITCDELSWYQDFSWLRPWWSCGCICFSHVNDRQFRNGSGISAPEVSDIASVLFCMLNCNDVF